MILARRHHRCLSDALPAAESPSAPDTTTPRRPLSVPHGLARDSPCRKSKDPGSVGGKVRLSPPVGFPALGWSSIAALCAHSGATVAARGQSRVFLAFAHSLGTQFQNRGALCLAQHLWLAVPFRCASPSG